MAALTPEERAALAARARAAKAAKRAERDNVVDNVVDNAAQTEPSAEPVATGHAEAARLDLDRRLRAKDITPEEYAQLLAKLSS